MGVISVGASLGVVERNAGRAPNAPASVAAAAASHGANANLQPGAATLATFQSIPSASATATTATTAATHSHHNHHHNARRQHEYNSHSGPPHHPQAAYGGGGGGGGGRPNKRGGRRKYTQNNNHQQPNTNANASTSAAATMASNGTVASLPPPPIVTSTTALSAPASASVSTSTTTPSPAAKAPRANSNPSPVTSGNAKRSTAAAPASSSQVVRIVAFETNVDPQLLVPFLLGAKGGARLQGFMTQSKCTMVYRPASAGPVSDEVVIRLGRSSSSAAPSPLSTQNASSKEKRLSFVLTADTTNRVDHGLRLLQGAIETAEQILARKKRTLANSAAVAVATTVAVDSGGNGKPSSGHASASRAVMPDHSIDDPPPPSLLASNSLSSSASLSSHGHGHEINRDSVDERKAQTRIRYPPTNQPLKRGPGFAPSRSIAESPVNVTPPAPLVTTHGVDKTTSKKRQLPPSSDGDTSRCEPNKRERTSTQPDVILHEEHPRSDDMTTTTTGIVSTTPAPDAHPSGRDNADAVDPEFDEFRIRLTRGIEFARQVDAQAARLKQQVLREKQRYMQMVQQSQLMKHQQRVADVVIRTQCAIMATSEASGRKRRRIEQLSATQDAMQKSLRGNKTKPGPLRASGRFTADRLSNPSASADLADLMKKVSAFRAAVSKNAVECPSKETLAVSAGVDDSHSTPVKSAIDVPEVSSKRNAEAAKTPAAPDEAHDFGTPDATDGEKQNDVFRPRHLAPGQLRDMNLIQDYTDESDWGLLRLLIGQRQYFYLEPISLSFGTSDLKRLHFEATRTTKDLEIMRDFIAKRRRFGGDLLKSVQSVAGLQAFSSSKASSWTSMQRSLLEIHPLLLVLHLLALHYHAATVLEQKKMALDVSKPDLLSSEDELSSDLFKFVLRPIRSSAIESSLNDALPISLVRETIAHCPEVVNHVLAWKEESDVPPVLLDDVMSAQSKKDKSIGSSSSGSPMLSETLRHLQRYADDFDRSLGELARHFQGLRGGTVSGDKIVHLVNQLKAVGARLLVANTQLQLHKWATVFVENGFSWFDDDMDDNLEGDSGFGGDRSYDKFTCLQDALFVWHNASLSYSARDPDDAQCAKDGIRSVAALRTETKEPESEDALDQAGEDKDDVELGNLRRMTTADVLNVVETNFTDRQTVAAYFLTSDGIAQTRKQFNDSITVMRASMKVLGRTAPWRTHVKHSNVLKVEYTKQRELENKLLLHQWAAYYKARPLPGRAQNPPISQEDKESGSNLVNAEEKDQRCDTEDEKAVVEETPITASDQSTDSGIVLEPGDTPEVVDMKLLRHEIENVAKQMHSMGDGGPVDVDRKKLLDACNLLAASCVSALTKFLSHDEPPQPGVGPVSARAARQRANSVSKTGSSGADAASVGPASCRSQLKPKQRSKSKLVNEEATSVTSGAQDDHVDGQEDSHTNERETGKPEVPSNTKRAKKGSPVVTARRPRAHSTSSASPRIPSAVTPAPVVPPLPNRTSESKVVASHASAVAAIPAEPLRMGCSGCRDTRRRCTGCHGCCLHCVCLGCGCRMCCSSRTASVQRTLNLLVTAVETRMGCKWIELDTIGDHSERCRMVKACSVCQQCVYHCTCHPSVRASYRECADDVRRVNSASTSATAGFPSAAVRKERRFRINPTAAQRRQTQASGDSDDDTSGSSGRRTMSAGKSSHTTTKRTRRSNSDATPSMFRDESVDATTASDFMSSEFSGSSTDGIPFVSPNPPAHHKNEQEDLFRAARVRMKLQRNTVLKATHPYGLIPPNTLIEDEMLWHPDRIRLMWERKDVYAVLGVPREASPQLIKKQYRKLVLKLHPDKALGAGETPDAACPNSGESWTLDDRVSAFVAVTQAYKLLSGDIGAIHGNAWKMPTTTSL